MKIGFIGTGNMATAIIRGMLANGVSSAENILASDKDVSCLNAFCSQNRVRPCSSNRELAETADIIVLAIKPGVFGEVLDEVSDILRTRKPLLISIAAGTSLTVISHLAGHIEELPVVRVMPNVNTEVGASMTALCANAAATQEQVQLTARLFNSLGRTMLLKEELFSAFMAVSSAAAAFAAMFIEGLAKGGLKAGMTKADATLAATQTVLGTAKLILETSMTPSDVVDRVCSPGGTTIAGVSALEHGKFTATVMDAVDAAIQKDKALLEGNK